MSAAIGNTAVGIKQPTNTVTKERRRHAAGKLTIEIKKRKYS